MRGFIVVLLSVLAAAPVFAAEGRPLVIGHRGASGHLPEHTIEAYTLAIDMGADFIEPDLVSTMDGVLIARHENELSDTTDVAEKFPERKKTKAIDGREMEGWFSEDFTLAEIKTLRAKERVPFRNQTNNGKFAIPTFAEVIDLAARKGRERGRVVGIYPETKHPTYFQSIHLPLEEPLVKALTEAGLSRADAPVFIQSFEVDNLKKLKGLTPVKLVQLLDDVDERPYDQQAAGKATTYGDIISDAGLAEVATYAKAIGPWKNMILPVAKDGAVGRATDLVARAHKAGLSVYPYTFRSDPQALPAGYNGDPAAEYCRFAALGVDGFFSDFPDAALKALSESCPMSAR